MSNTMTPVTGDPGAVAAAASTLASIAAEVAATASQLRTLARSGSSWTGAAASTASARAATLPPKLDKAHASYATAATALRGYATALNVAQQESAAACRAGVSAAADVTAAQAAQQAAADRDAAAARAAATAGQPPPAPDAPRRQPDIDAAQTRLIRARAANQAAHDAQNRAAKTAASALGEASRQGIHNKPWWQHLLSDAAKWADVIWTKSLRLISTVATTISAIAGIAALACAIAGLVFPPLEGAAAALESISLASAQVGVLADVALAATGKASWTALAWDAAALAPSASSRVLRRLAPRLGQTKLVKGVAKILSGEGKAQRADGAISPVGREHISYPVIVGKGSGTRNIHYRPHGTNPKWGLTKAHATKHLFGPKSTALRTIDSQGNAELWRGYMQELAGRPATSILPGGIEDVVGSFPKADGSGAFKFGIRISRRPGNSFDLVTLLTRQ